MAAPLSVLDYLRNLGASPSAAAAAADPRFLALTEANTALVFICLLYTSDAAGERSRVDFGGRRIIKKKKKNY